MEYATPKLACSLADKWLEVASEVRGSMQELAVAIRSFLAHLGSQIREAGRDDFFDLSELRRRHLDSWEAALLKEQQQNPTDTRYRQAIHLFALLRRINDDTPDCLHREVVDRLERQTRLIHIRREGEPEFPPEEVELPHASQLLLRPLLGGAVTKEVWGIDSYAIPVYPEEHPAHGVYLQVRGYWDWWLGRVRDDDEQVKGYLEVVP